MTKKSRKNLARNIPLSIDKDLLAAVDAVAGERDETRSLIMRKAIQAGLPIVKGGSTGDVLTLDSELSSEVDQASKETGLRRSKIIMEAIRAGLQAYTSRVVSEKLSLAEVQDPKQREQLMQMLEESYRLNDNPVVKELRKLALERGNATCRLWDILEHVPEAKRRETAVNRWTEIRRRPGGGGGGPGWMSGLSTEEMEWQIGMADKYEPSIANWPKEEIDARVEARAREDRAHRDTVG